MASAGRRSERERVRSALAELKRSIEGEVRFDAGSRALYATDASNYRQAPLGVVLPKSAADAARTLEVCRGHDLPVLPRGGGTSLAGQCCNAAVILDFSKHMRRVLELDAERGTATVEPGVVLDALRAAARPHGLTFGPDPATHAWCTLGGMIGNNSCGVHSVTAGRTSDNVESLEALTYRGERLSLGKGRAAGLPAERLSALERLAEEHAAAIREKFPRIPRRVSGFALDELLPERGFHAARALVGSEGACVTLLSATVRLVEARPGRALLVLGYPDVAAAADHVPEVLATGPYGLEAVDERLAGFLRRKGLHAARLELLPEGGAWLLAEFGAACAGEARAAAEAARAALGRGRLISDPGEQEGVWELRESGLGATAHVPGQPEAWPGWEDAAVAPVKLGAYLREFRRLTGQYGYKPALYGHFGDGCVHCRIDFGLRDAEGVRRFRAFIEDAARLVVSHGGSLSGEHGDGQARGALLELMYGKDLVAAFRAFKAVWDPDGRMNPGKVVDARPPDEDLRLGADWRPARVETVFGYPEDAGRFNEAALRCVGVGKCRDLEGGVMCPSYKVTLEEKHSTRGRARLLFEMLDGSVLKDGWREEAVKEALDLCLSCKGCKGECPVHVDMATYKAEFLSHYYRGRLRPRAAYAMGLIPWWAPLASKAPALFNALLGVPGAKALGGIASQRSLPRFAPRTFRELRRPPAVGGREEVLLWTDTFTNHFDPAIALSAAAVLDRLGFTVRLPPPGLCCGRPLYDFGMLGLARRLLRRTLDALSDDIVRGVPVVVLEPSCAAVFRDELPSLLAGDEHAARLAKQTLLLSELVERRRPEASWRPLGAQALVQLHCHQRSVLSVEPEARLLGKLGLDWREPEPGCCGMAGAFGFEAGERYEVSRLIGERALLPAARAAGRALVVADGFSCREQLRQGAGASPLHLAQLLERAL